MHRNPTLPAPPPSDPLGGVLQDLRLSGVSYGRCELGRPWGLHFREQGPARFHFMHEGGAWLRVTGGEWVPLRQGDMVLLPRGTGHSLADAPGSPLRAFEELPSEPDGGATFRVRGGGDGPRSLLFCGSVGLDEPALRPLLDLMPLVIHGEGVATEDPTLPALLQTMAEEVAARRVGSATILSRLADVVVARLLRHWIERHQGETSGWLAAVRDPHVGRALVAIHRDPGERWTVGSLARLAHASRSTFTERFTAAVGMPPARYLTHWRMHLARDLLRSEHTTVSEVAARLGYDSEPAFSRAFKRVMGSPPSELRRPAAGTVPPSQQ